MRTQRTALLCLIVALITTSADYALAQKIFSRSASPNVGDRGPVKPSAGGGYHGGGFRGPGGGVVVPGIIVAVPQGYPPDGPVIDGGPSRPQRRSVSGAPGAIERSMVPDEVVIELSNASTQQVDAMQRQFDLTRIESQPSQLSNTTLYRWRIPDRRSVATVVRALEGDGRLPPRNQITCLRYRRATSAAKAIRLNMSSPNCIFRKHTRWQGAATSWWL